MLPMTWNLWKKSGGKKAERTSKRLKKKTYQPNFEQLETRWLPSGITLGLYDDTSIGAKITSDGKLWGSITDTGYSVSGKTVTFSGGVTGTTSTDGNGNYQYTPTLSSQGAYNNIVATFTDHTSTNVSSTALSFVYDSVAPTTTLTAPTSSDAARIQVTVSA